MADIIEFPKPETFSEFLVFLAELHFRGAVTGCSAVIHQDKCSTPYFFNVDAGKIAFHSLLLQQSALDAGKEV